MPITNAKKTEILEKLRLECDRDELTAYDDLSPESFSNMVKQDVETIVAKGLNNHCPNWGENVKQLLYTKKFKYEGIADRMGIHHTTVLDALKKSVADPFYLEVFSLLLQVSPYELIGLKLPRPISPMSYWADQNKAFSNIIMNMYCKCDSLQEQNRLKAIIKVGKLLPNAYKEFMADYGSTKGIQGAFEFDPYNSPLSRDSSWMLEVLNHVSAFKQAVQENDTEQHERHYLFLEAYYVTLDLERKDPKRLEFLAQIALTDGLEKWLVNLMLTRNYPYTHTKLQEYAIENMFESSAPCQTKAAEKTDAAELASPQGKTPAATKKLRGQKVNLRNIY